MYVYADFHEFYFCELPILLYEWKKRNIETTNIYIENFPMVRIEEKIEELKILDNKLYRVIESWFLCMIEGYIKQFVIGCSESYSSA